MNPRLPPALLIDGEIIETDFYDSSCEKTPMFQLDFSRHISIITMNCFLFGSLLWDKPGAWKSKSTNNQVKFDFVTKGRQYEEEHHDFAFFNADWSCR